MEGANALTVPPAIMAIAAVVSVIFNALMLLIAAIGVIRANRESVNQAEQRITTRISALEVSSATLATKVQRAESDIQAIFRTMPKRSHNGEPQT